MRVFSCFLIAAAALSGADILKVNKLPLVFEPNQGQVDSQVRFLARGGGFTLFLTDREAVMSMKGAPPVRMSLVGGAKSKEFEGLEPTGGISNYFIGNDPSKWRTEIPQYRRVKYRGVYPGVDLVYYGDGGKLEYDLLVAPGADASRIEIAYWGVDSMRVDEQGDLLLKTARGELRQQRPKVYQQDNGKRIEVGARYRLHGRKQVAFELARYDRAKPLVIDPVFVYSTYLGGGSADLGQSGQQFGYGIAVDGSGNAYVTGYTNSTDFPTVGAGQGKRGYYYNAFVTKFNPSGSALIYSTYLGGSNNDGGQAIAVDGGGNAYVTGVTTSTDFPIVSPLQSTNGGGGSDAFVTKISASGSALVYSTYLGGSSGDSGYGIAVDGNGNAYVTGQTSSTDFPTASPLQGTYGGGGDAFVTKINASGSAKVYSTYLGGSSGDYGYGIALDGSGNAYVTGYTTSTDFPTASPLQGTYGGGGDAFVTKINAGGSAKVYSTYLGGIGVDVGQAIAVDGSGNAYVTGATSSTDFPTASPLQGTNGGGGNDAFVTKINAGGSAKVYSTYLGGSGYDYGQAIAVDGSGNAYVTGYTQSTDFPTVNPFQAGNHGSQDAFVSVISSNAPTAVPNVVGLSQAAATTAITSVGLVLGTVSTAASGTVPTGDVISESPVAGTVVSLATAVNLVVSTGPGQVLVPNVVGLTQAAATTTITSAGLVVGTVTMMSSGTVPSGSVISENPVAGASVSTGSAVNLVVSGSPVIPILDFNGSAYQDVFLYDPVAGVGYAALSNGSGAFTYIYSGFTPGFDAIRYGNFTNSGLSDLVAYNSTTATGYVLLGSGTGTFSSAVSLFWGPGFTKVAAGDLNGDGLTDFVLYRPTDGTSYTAISNGDGTFRYQYTLVSGNFTNVVVADFNGDGKADVFYYRSTDGLAYLGISNGTGGFTFSPVSLSAGYTFVESGDINGDGKADVLFYNGTSGAAAVGLSAGSGFTFTPLQYSPGFTSVKLFDFNGDGKADVALYNMNTTIGYLGISNGTGNFTFSSLFWGPGFSTVDALDLNGDGKIDVVIYNTSNAAAYTGISTGNPANPFSYQYSFWGTGKVLATTAAQP